MEGFKGNTIDLRKIKSSKPKAVPASGPARRMACPPIGRRACPPDGRQAGGLAPKRKIRIVPLLAIGLIDIALIVYFTLSNNYLAAFFFFLAALLGTFGLFKKKIAITRP